VACSAQRRRRSFGVHVRQIRSHLGREAPGDKSFVIREGKILRFRTEFYNTFNHTQYSAVNTTAQFNPAGVMANANFGKVTAARTERRMQLSLRFNF
jgi:hypothetical protein